MSKAASIGSTVYGAKNDAISAAAKSMKGGEDVAKAGSVAFGILGATVNAIDEMAAAQADVAGGMSSTRAATLHGSRWAFSTVGAIQGAEYFGTLGAAVGPEGAIVGAVLGGIGGGLVGKQIGNMAGGCPGRLF